MATAQDVQNELNGTGAPDELELYSNQGTDTFKARRMRQWLATTATEMTYGEAAASVNAADKPKVFSIRKHVVRIAGLAWKINEDVTAIKSDVAAIKADVAAIKAKVGA